MLTRALVEDISVLPRKEARFAAERAVIRFISLPADRCVCGRQRGHSRAAGDHRLPEFSELTHGVVLIECDQWAPGLRARDLRRVKWGIRFQIPGADLDKGEIELF